MPQHVRSKWKKTSAIKADPYLRRLVPRTSPLNRSSLLRMLERYGMAYAKPNVGTHGKGVMKAEHKRGRFRFQSGRKLRSFGSFEPMAGALLAKTRGKSYLVQQGIRLLKYKGRVYDLRIMAQMNHRGTWETTGMIGRIAAPGKIVTNYHGGGRLVSVGRLLDGHMGRSAKAAIVRQLAKIGVLAGRAMRRRFAGVREVGVDVGLDRSRKPWIIEVNTLPDPYIFRKLPDPSVFKRIRKYQKAYGRK